MMRKTESSPRMPTPRKPTPRKPTPRMAHYVPLIREFAARDELFHDAVARRLGLHPTDEKVLRFLGDNAVNAKDLASYMGLTGAAVTAMVDRLESLGYVTRERNGDDRRRVTIRAVSARLRKINKIYGGLHAAMQRLLSDYDTAEFAIVIDYLTRTTKVLAEQAAKVGGPPASRKMKAQAKTKK
jgi:DNA-binding MarR family transcriptional regulator